jgi:hypothetical protein
MQGASRTVTIFGVELAALWRDSAMSQETFAHAIGMKRSGFLRLMKPGEHGMFTDNFRRLAEAVRMSPDELRRRIGANPSGSSGAGVSGILQPLREMTSFHGVSAGARNERLAVERGKVKVPDDLGEFAVRVDGDSMSPEYPDGALALFEAVEGQQFVFGKEYLLWFANEECYFSRVSESDDDRDQLLLQKINPDRERFPDQTVHRREVTRIARCVGVVIRKT